MGKADNTGDKTATLANNEPVQVYLSSLGLLGPRTSQMLGTRPPLSCDFMLGVPSFLSSVRRVVVRPLSVRDFDWQSHVIFRNNLLTFTGFG